LGNSRFPTLRDPKMQFPTIKDPMNWSWLQRVTSFRRSWPPTLMLSEHAAPPANHNPISGRPTSYFSRARSLRSAACGFKLRWYCYKPNEVAGLMSAGIQRLPAVLLWVSGVEILGFCYPSSSTPEGRVHFVLFPV
jgi:hypothetical protein